VKRLFLKIFLWFWATAILTGFALVLVVMLQHRQIHPEDHDGLAQTIRYFGTAAADITERNGPAAGSEYLKQLSHDVRIQACLFSGTGKPISGERCDGFQKIVRGVLLGDTSDFSMPNNIVRMAVPIRRPGKSTYIFASELPVGPRAMLQLDLSAIVVRGGLALVISALVCYVLAQFLTGPILNLRSAAQRITDGDLNVRADQKLIKRKDELGDLVRDFNRMADTNQRVISRQRQLLYDVSHELRSPLTRMNVALDLLRTRTGEDPALVRIERDVQRLNEMIGRLLTVTKLENSSTLLNPAPLALSDLVRSIASDADFEAQKNGSHVTVVNAPDVSMIGDYSLLRSAIENVVRNAVRHTKPDTSVDIRLDAPTKADQMSATITVRDYGTGVPEEDLANIFEPFYRVIDAENNDENGMGLGLSITDRVVRLHGGTTEAANAPGPGLLVTIRLPLSAQMG
jgi:two-component system, OmpR family, sensor histidine kinase CpxA